MRAMHLGRLRSGRAWLPGDGTNHVPVVHLADAVAALILLASLAALILGIVLITLGYKIRAATEREWMLYLAGALSVGFGLAMYFHPAFAGISLALLAGTWALIVGILRIMIAFKVRKLTTNVGERLRAVS
jgi:uncharacterized membrane protein HdeD (DUF308 family)